MAPESRVELRSFNPAFEQICAIVAIGEIRDRGETLRRLIIHCISELSGDGLRTGAEVVDTLDQLYGLRVPPAIAQEALDDLLKRGDLEDRGKGGGLIVRPQLEAEVRTSIAATVALEERVREEWLDRVSTQEPEVAQDFLWAALKSYLFRAFRRHGIQAGALLDPSIEITPEHSESLSALLRESVEEHVDEQHRRAAAQLISGFLAEVGQYRPRSAYLSQLADGVFSYFSLTVSPEAAATLRKGLSPLKLFLDTNFIFGIVKLGEHVWADLSGELVDLAQEKEIPFNLLYHSRTDREVNATIQHYESYLGGRTWGNGLARAAVRSRDVSGVVKQYLEQYLRTGVDARTFFRPFRHVDELLRSKEITEYVPADERQNERANLLHEYREFLETRGRPKPYNVVEHDATILDAVRSLRSEVQSSIEAGALLLSYDYNLYRFDWENSRRKGRPPCVVLPNLFWQMIRPFVPADEDFDRSFAETFALPEFRTLGSGASAACSRMLAILASYQDVPEETASRLLTNDLLLDRLQGIEGDLEFKEAVEGALVEENRELLEEREYLRKEAEAAVGRVTAVELQLSDEHRLRREAERDSERDREDRQKAEEASKLLKDRLDRMRDWFAILASLAAGSMCMWALGRANLVVGHPREMAIRALSGLLTTWLLLGLMRPKMRKVFWWGSGGALVVAVVLASIL